MNILSLFVVIPVLMLLGLWLARNDNQVRGVMVAGATCLLGLSIYLVFAFLDLRETMPADQYPMLFTDSIPWFEPLHIHYAIGVDGISVVMLLLSAIIVFTGTFASWQMEPMKKEYFLWFVLLSTGVFGFFISVDMFTMFMFYEVALIPMYLLIGVWGSGAKEYSAMKLTLMLMGGSALLIIGILAIYYFSGATTMNVVEIANMANIPEHVQKVFFPFVFIGFGVLGALFPFHTWSPDGHASAPTAVSMLHAGVLMKLGGYGCFRIAMYLLPEALDTWAPVFLVLTTISVFFSEPLRHGAFRFADDDADRYHRCRVADVVPWFNDGSLLRGYRYDLSPCGYSRRSLSGRIDEDCSFPVRGICSSWFGQLGLARFLGFRSGDDHLCGIVPERGPFPSRMYHLRLYLYRGYGRLHLARGG